MASIRKPTQTPPAALRERFLRLAETWHEAVAHHSSSSVRHGHPAYQEIIRMGPAVVPLLLQDLQATGRHWYAALQAITGVWPVPPEDAGKIERMKAAWLRWGRENGYQW